MRFNEFYNLYPTHETGGSSQWVYSLAVDDVYSFRNRQFCKDMGIYSTSPGVTTWLILAQVIQ